MKLLYILFILNIVAVFTSCDKKLDIDPQQSVDAQTAINSPSSVDAAAIGMYTKLAHGALYGTNLLLLPELQASDNYVSWVGTFESFRQVAEKRMTRDNGEAVRTWRYAYEAINMANIVLEALDFVEDPDQRDALEGEALFVRGLMHFELVRLFARPWGATPGNTHPGVAIKTKATKDETAAFERIPRSNVSEVYTQVINDLTAAAGKLPDDNGTRANKYAAYAFLSRVYLQQHDYEKALDAASTVIEEGNFSINASVAAAFDNKNTAESIFEIQQNDQNNAGIANDGMATFYASMVGVGRADVRMLSAFLNTYEDEDMRKILWYYQGEGIRPGHMYCGKWKSYSQNLPVIRLVEMYLTRAECNLRLGSEVGDAPANDLAQVINPIRVNLPVISTPTLEQVLTARKQELAFEGLRIHDAKRLQASTGAYAWDANELVFPIPQREVDATEGVIVQNPGY